MSTAPDTPLELSQTPQHKGQKVEITGIGTAIVERVSPDGTRVILKVNGQTSKQRGGLERKYVPTRWFALQRARGSERQAPWTVVKQIEGRGSANTLEAYFETP